MAQQFALGSPRAYQPSSAEDQILGSMLGKLNGNDASRLGMMLLGNYQQERANTESNYDAQVQRQNAFAQQQAQNALMLDRQKQAIELYGKPEGASIIAGTPSLAYSLASDISAPALQSAASTLRAGELAKTLQAAGIGSYNLTEAGQPTNAASIGALIPGMQFSDQAPLALQKEAMAQSGANARAAAKNAQDKIGYTLNLGNDPTTGQPLGNINMRGPLEQVATERDRATARLTPGGNYQSGGGPSTAPPGAGPGMSGTSAPGSRVTSQSGNPYDVTTPAGQATQAQGRAMLGALEQKARGGDPQAQAVLKSVQANMGGGTTIPMRPGKNGQPGLLAHDANGREIIVQ